jgi:hypothetical protein
VDVVGGVDQVCVVPVALAHRLRQPLVVGLRGEAQHPAGHRDGDLLGGEFTDQRVNHSGARRGGSRPSPAAGSRSPAPAAWCAGAAPAAPPTRLACGRPHDRSSPAARRRPCRSAILNQRCRQDSESRSRGGLERSALRCEPTAITSRRNPAGSGLGTMPILRARPQPRRQGVNRAGGSHLHVARPTRRLASASTHPSARTSR